MEGVARCRKWGGLGWLGVMDVQTMRDISRTLKIEVKLLLSANRKLYMRR